MTPNPLPGACRASVQAAEGIYTYTGLLAVAEALAPSARRESPHRALRRRGRRRRAGSLRRTDHRPGPRIQNTTISVVALGKESDSDAIFLKDVAARGGGEIYFSGRPRRASALVCARHDAPRLVPPSSTSRPPRAWKPVCFRLPRFPPGPWLNLPGYNLCYPAPGRRARHCHARRIRRAGRRHDASWPGPHRRVYSANRRAPLASPKAIGQKRQRSW